MPTPHYISILSLTFNLPLRHEDIEMFRKSVCAVAGKDSDLFHNERIDNDAEDDASEGEAETNSEGNGAKKKEKQYIERYPLIQYQAHGGRASIIGLNEGAEALLKLEKSKKYKDLKLFGLEKKMPIEIMDRRQDVHFPLSFLEKDQTIHYRIYGYLPLNPQNYNTYKSLTYMADKIAFVEKIMANHIKAFAKGMAWRIPTNKTINLRIIDLDRIEKLSVLGVHMMGFDMVFGVNLKLPERMGLGRKTAFGFGWIFEAGDAVKA